MLTTRDPQAKKRAWPVAYGAAVIAAVAATLLRLALTPLLGGTAVPFITFFPAVLFAAWYGGFRVGALTILLSVIGADYYFVSPLHSFLIPNPVDQITLLIFAVVGFGMALLSHSQRSALERADQEASLRRGAELAERAERQRFQTTLASIGDAVIATDASGHVSFMNHVAELLTGWKQEEASGKSLESVFQIINEESRQQVDNPALLAMREGRIVGLANHTALIARDGSETPIDDAGSPIRDAEGKTIGAVLIFRDVTERRRAEKERELLAEQTRMLNSGFDAVIVRDAGNRITSWNRVAEKLYGWSADEVLGQVTYSLFKTTFPKPLTDIVADLHKDGRWEGELVHTCKDGSTKTVLSHWMLDRDAEGRPRSVLEINIDISERKRIEQRLLENRQMVTEVVERAPFGIYIVDSQFRIAHMNADSQAGAFRNVRPVIGRDFAEAMRILWPEPVAADIVAIFRHTLETGEPYYSPRFTNARHDVEAVESYEWQVHRITLPDEQFGVICYYYDSTTLRESEQREQILRQSAEEANRAKDEFLAMVSHELRNPLSSILGWASVLRAGQMPLERAGHALEVIERNARLEGQLVESLLDLSRIAAGKLILDSERVDLASVLQVGVDSVRPAADSKGINLEISAPSELVLVGDSGRLQQVLSNILVNAVKFTPRGGHIQVRLMRAGSQAQIRIIDNGEGIEADFLPHIFDRFRQAESTKSRSHGGLGLGLAIVRELVQGHGGTVAADSPGRGRGSTFTITLPIPAVIPPHVKPTSPRLTQGEEPSISGLRILVVDDDADARELIGLTLGRHEAAVRLTSSAAEALQCVSEDKFDVMIADIGMPHADGYVLIQTIRALERDSSRARLPAIALTAFTTVADRDQALAAGYDLHLAKPVGPEDLLHGVAKFRKSIRA